MLLDLKMPLVMPDMPGARIEAIYATVGQAVAIGGKLCDISVDLAGAFAQNCPPISYYRLVSRERAWLRRAMVVGGDLLAPAGILAWFSTEADEPLEGPAARPMRVTTAGILWHPAMWSATSSA